MTRQDRIKARVGAFLKTRVKGKNGAWPEITDTDWSELYVLCTDIIAAKFDTDETGDSPVNLLLIDRTKFEPHHFVPVPYQHKVKKPSDKLEILRLIEANLNVAAEQLNRFVKHSDIEERTPKVGVGLFLVRREGNKKFILLSQRKKEYGKDEWSLPGGHVKEGEEPMCACARELLEETGIKATGPVRPLTFLNSNNPAVRKHYVTLYYYCDGFKGKPKDMEPDKHGPWKWFDIEKLPKPCWQGINTVVQKFGDIF